MSSTTFSLGGILLFAFLFWTCDKENNVVNGLAVPFDTLKVLPRTAVLAVGQSMVVQVKGGTKPYSFSSPSASLYQILASTDSSILLSPLDSGLIVIRVSDNSSPVQRDSVLISAFFAGPVLITEDVFPLVVGHSIRYSGFLRDQAADTNITSTGLLYQASWTVTANSVSTPFGPAHIVRDSTFVPTGIPSPPGVWVASDFSFQRPSPTGTENFRLLYNFGRFYRTFSIQRPDSMRWILAAKLDAGIGISWTAFDSTWTASVGGTLTPVRLEIVGVFEGQETLLLSSQTFNAYKLTLSQRIYLGGSATPIFADSIASVWLAPNVGPVKMILHSDGENYGHYREFVSKNF